MPILALPGEMTPGQLGPISRDFEVLELGPDLDHVERGNALGDGDDQRNARVLGFENRVGGKRRRHKNHRRVGAGLGHGVGHGVEDGPAFVRRPALARSHAADNLGAVLGATFGVEGAFFAGKSLNDEASVLITLRLPSYAAPRLAAFTTNSAASFIVSPT